MHGIAGRAVASGCMYLASLCSAVSWRRPGGPGTWSTIISVVASPCSAVSWRQPPARPYICTGRPRATLTMLEALRHLATSFSVRWPYVRHKQTNQPTNQQASKPEVDQRASVGLAPARPKNWRSAPRGPFSQILLWYDWAIIWVEAYTSVVRASDYLSGGLY